MKFRLYQFKAITNELDNFIDQLNKKYDLGLIKSEYKIINTTGWKTTNKIIYHVNKSTIENKT